MNGLDIDEFRRAFELLRDRQPENLDPDQQFMVSSLLLLVGSQMLVAEQLQRIADAMEKVLDR